MRRFTISVGNRVATTVVAVLAILFTLAFCGYRYWEEEPQKDASLIIPFMLASAESTPVELPLCMDDQTREQIKGVILEALDNSLKNHIEHVFEIWLRDARGQPDRARTGVQQGLRAYLGARKAALDWTPPLCSG